MWIIIFWTLGTLFLIKVLNSFSTGKCYVDNVMSGKVVIVTGANSGIGYQTAKELARRGAKVILACRDDIKGERAEKSIKKKTNNNNVRYEHLDLSSFESIRKFVENFMKSEAKLDVLINNAGASGMSTNKTSDGIVKDMQVNYLGPFLLTVLLVPLLKKSAPSRIINVSSYLHRFGTIDNLNESCNFLKLYSNSSLCNVLFSNELARKLKDTGVVVNSLNPGPVNTSLYRTTIIEKLRTMVLYTFFKTPEAGAQTSIYLAVSDDCDQVTGRYYEDCTEGRMSWKAMDENMAAKLWMMSEEYVKLRKEEAI